MHMRDLLESHITLDRIQLNAMLSAHGIRRMSAFLYRKLG